MRERSRLVINRETGRVESHGTELILDDAGFAQRFADLKASTEADMPGSLARIAAVMCDGCGATVEVDYKNPELPKGWTAQERGDFCARCSAGTN